MSTPEFHAFASWPMGLQWQLTPRKRALWGALVITSIVVLIYAPARCGGFLLDDDLLVSGNSVIKSPDGLWRIWFTTQSPDYWPVTNTSLWLDWRLWGMNTAGYHGTNVALHILGALLMWRVLRRLAVPGAFLAALLFAVHPVNVESVAWIAQRKNLLSLIFFLVSIDCFLSFVDQPLVDRKRRLTPGKTRWYWFSLTSFTLAMLSKGSAAVLPGALLLILWWRNGRIAIRDFVWSAPFFAISIGLTLVNVCLQSRGAADVIRNANLVERLLGAGAAVWFYLAKSLIPLGLTFVYPAWNIHSADWRWWAPIVAAAGATAVLLGMRRTRWGRPLLVAWSFFGLALVPVMGFVDVGFMRYSLVADHYAHLALVGISAALGAGVVTCIRRLPKGYQRAPAFAISAVVCTFAALTFRHSQVFADPIALYRHTVENNPSCFMAHNNLGNSLKQIGQLDDAIEHYQAAIGLKPDYADAYSNLGCALVELGRWSEAIENCRHAVQLKPSEALLHNNLAMALAHTNRHAAVREYEQALKLKPNFAEAESNLGAMLAEAGDSKEALEHLEHAIRMKPDYAPAHSNLGTALGQLGNSQRACMELKMAVQLDPNSAELRSNYGAALVQAGNLPEAIEQYTAALTRKPDFAQAESNLGAALAQSGRLDDAVAHYRAAIRLNPDSAEAHFNLGLALGKCGHHEAALQEFREVIRLQPADLQSYLNVAATCAQLKRTEEATTAAKAALALARAGNQFELAKKIDAWISEHR